MSKFDNLLESLIKESKPHSLGNVLASYYHEGKGIDNETLHHILAELEEILTTAKHSDDPAFALEQLISALSID